MSLSIEPKDAWRVILADNERVYNSNTVGHDGVTAIKRVGRPGMYGEIPYIEIWHGDRLTAEFCQHSIVGVIWEKPQYEDEVPI